MTEPLEPLPPDVEALLVAERELPPEDSALKGAVLRRVTLAIGPAGGGGEPGDGGPEDGGRGDGSVGGSGPAPDLATPVGSVASATVVKTAAAVGLAAFLAGGAAGSLLTASLMDSAPAAAPAVAIRVDAPLAPTVRSIATSSSPVDPAPPAPPSASARAPRASATTDPARSPRLDLDRERELLDVARGALARGNPEGALDALQEHVRTFPGAQLAEERHALMVQALAAAGRGDEARAVASDFRRRYPTSMLMPVVDAAAPP